MLGRSREREASPHILPQGQDGGRPGWGGAWSQSPGVPWDLALFAGDYIQGFPLCFPRVEEDLDQILNLGAEPKPQPPPKPQPKPKPPVAAKPALPRKPAVPPRAGLPEVAVEQRKQQQIQAMDEMDILQYIQDHDAPGQTAPSLF